MPNHGAGPGRLPFPPETIHRGTRVLPFVEISPGYSAQILHVNLQTGLWVSRSRLAPGYRSPRHSHTGEVFGFTNNGYWYYLEQPEAVNEAGSYLYEPAGSVHTQCVPQDNIEPVDIWFVIHGRVEAMDEAGTIINSSGAAEMLETYIAACRKAGFETPAVIIE